MNDTDRETSSADPYRDLPQPPPVEKKQGGVWTAVAAIFGGILLKLKPILLLLQGLKFGKFFLTAFSMFAMIWFEAVRYGWIYGFGFVLLILVHELGHGYAIKKSGLQSGWPVFIPFFGAMITMNGRPQRATTEAYIAFAGPIAGTAASILCAGYGMAFDSRMALSLGFTGLFLNMFNLVPISPLDGGRVAQLFSKKAWIVGIVLLVGLFVLSRSPALILIGVMALMNSFRQPTEAQIAASPEERTTWALRYFGLIAFLAASMYFTQRLLHPDRF
jgi:Zn-dependent protease